MKNRFKLEINNPCDANLSVMEKTDTGFFCSSCEKNVIDLSSKTSAEVVQIVSELKGKNSICAQLRSSQLEEVFEYKAIDKTKRVQYAVAVAASVLLTANVVAQENPIQNKEQNHQKADDMFVGYIQTVRPNIKMLSFTLKGKLLDSTANKPISENEYHEITILVNGAQQRVVVNPKNGVFSIPVIVQENSREINFNIYAEGYFVQKTIPFELKSIKRKVLKQTIKINPIKEFQSYKTKGDLGLIYDYTKTKFNT